VGEEYRPWNSSLWSFSTHLLPHCSIPRCFVR
jgi:hypothetical protein